MKIIKETAGRAIIAVIFFTILCGVIYPWFITGIAQLFFKDKADGSIIEVDGVQYGSELLGQQFTGEEYLWGRVVYANTVDFTGKEGSSAAYGEPSNLSPAGDEFERLVKERVDTIRAANPDAPAASIPVDLVTSSGSGLDPHISADAAEYQIPRLAKERHMSQEEVMSVIEKYTSERFLGIFGERTVNVLQVNLALDNILK